MSALDRLIDTTPRESSGSTASSRFTFQINWAFLQLIERYSNKKPCVIILDLHDDVVIADDEVAPQTVEFFQLKGKETAGGWTDTKLTSKKKGAPLSIIGKLYDHKIRMGAIAKSASFVSNAACNLVGKDKSPPDDLPFSKITKQCKKTILDAIQQEHGLPAPPDCDTFLTFKITKLDVNESHIFTQGKLQDLTNKHYTSLKYPVGALYAAVGETLRRKSDNSKKPTSISELLSQKAITSSDFEQVMKEMYPSERLQELWTGLKPGLQADVGLKEVNKIEKEWIRYGIDRVDSGRVSAHKLRKSIIAAITAIPDTTVLRTSLEVIKEVRSAISPDLNAFTEQYVKAAILIEAHLNEE